MDKQRTHNGSTKSGAERRGMGMGYCYGVIVLVLVAPPSLHSKTVRTRHTLL